MTVKVLESSSKNNGVNKEFYRWNVMQLDMQNEGLSDEEQAERMEIFGQIFRSIYFDDSEDAERVIGTINGEDIIAKDFELRALKIREGEEAILTGRLGRR